MKIDPSKANLQEKDIEQYLWQNPSIITAHRNEETLTVDRWIARQLQVPSGIIDLFGILTNGAPVVVEVKNVMIDGRAIAQVLRYSHDIREILVRRTGRESIKPITSFVIGTATEMTALHECYATGVIPFVFEVQLTLSISQWGFLEDYKHQVESGLLLLSENDQLFGEFDNLFRQTEDVIEAA